MRLKEALQRLAEVQLPKPEIKPPGRKQFYRPHGSPLAKAVSKSVDTTLTEQEKKAKKEAEQRMIVAKQEKLREKELAERTKETRAELQSTYQKLRIGSMLEDVKETIWQGGEIIGPEIEAEPDKGRLTSGLVFGYTTATKGYWKHDEMERGILISTRTGYKPKLYTRSLIIEVAIGLDRKNDPQRHLSFTSSEAASCSTTEDWRTNSKKHQIPLHEGAEEEAIEQLRQLIIDDSTRRIMCGNLPVSKLPAAGKKEIQRVKRFASREKLKIQDLR